jgi:hypothetical protein
MCHSLDTPSIFLIGGYNGVTWLSSLDSFSPKKDILVPLTSMGSPRSYASVAAMEGCVFVFGGGDGSSWYNTGTLIFQFASLLFFMGFKLHLCTLCSCSGML